MLIGKKEDIAIEITIFERQETWVYGSFFLWIKGLRIGDPEDDGVHLNGCVNWLHNYLNSSILRYEEDLFEKSTEKVWDLLFHSVIVSNKSTEEVYENIIPRFHVTDMGMSSFDNYTIIMISSNKGEVRFVWQKNDGCIQEAIIEEILFKKIAQETIIYFETKIQNL